MRIGATAGVSWSAAGQVVVCKEIVSNKTANDSRIFGDLLAIVGVNWVSTGFCYVLERY